MTQQKSIFITGGTGNQGGAVVGSLLNDQRWNLKVLTRNPFTEKCKEYRNQGIEIIKGDLNNPSSYIDSLDGVYGVFSVQNFIDGIETEIRQGKLLVESAKAVGINHFVYSSVSGADRKTGIPHFDSKHIIENYIKELSIPYSIIRPTSFYENLLNPEVKKRILKGKLVMPLKPDLIQEYIGVQDIGNAASTIFQNPDNFMGRTVTISSDSLSMIQVSELLSSTMERKIIYEKLPGLISRLVMGKNLYKMFKWINKNEPTFVENAEKMNNEFSGMMKMKTWIEREFKNTAI